jgi:hypothetical protein
MDYSEKLKNFPSVNYISLYDNHERREFMENQFKKYGMKGVVHLNHPYSKLKEYVKVIPEHSEEWIKAGQLGITISHLMMIRTWLETTDEPYAIFTEDDISFKSLEYWNFTWDDFMSHLPKDWECVQLIRMESPFGLECFDRMRLDLRESLSFNGRWWGASWMMTRKYAENIVNQHYPEPGVFNLWHYVVMPISENILFFHRGYPVYNFPLLFENWQELKTTNSSVSEQEEDDKSGRDLSQQITKHLWVSMGSTLNLKEAMELK